MNSARISGRVTDDDGASKRRAKSGGALRKAAIEGATMTAAHIGSSGSRTALYGEVTTDASGAYTLDVEGYRGFRREHGPCVRRCRRLRPGAGSRDAGQNGRYD